MSETMVRLFLLITVSLSKTVSRTGHSFNVRHNLLQFRNGNDTVLKGFSAADFAKGGEQVTSRRGK